MNEEQAMVLAILLSKGDYKSKSPEYIREKVDAVLKGDVPEALLDSVGRAHFQRWLDEWHVRG